MARTDRRGGPQTRARIAEVAAGLFLARGYDAVTVAEVAREAGVSSVTVFKHFPRKEDLFLDRAADAAELLRAAVRERAPGVGVLRSLQETSFRLFDEQHALSGVNDRSVPFFRTVAGSAALLGRAREIGVELQGIVAAELAADASFDGDAPLLATLCAAGSGPGPAHTARGLGASARRDAVVTDHRVRLERLFDALCNGLGADT